MAHDHVSQGCSCQGTVYLLHFDRPYMHALHYLGWTRAGRLDERLAEHRAGQGARLMAVIKEAGIGFELARTWPGPRALERQLKRRHKIRRACPLCGIKPRAARPLFGAALDLPAVPNFTDPFVSAVTGASLALEPPY